MLHFPFFAILAQEFLENIHIVSKEEVDNCPFMGTLIDETVNITVNKKLIVFLRYVRDGSPHMVCGNYMYTVPAGDAETVYNKVK